MKKNLLLHLMVLLWTLLSCISAFFSQSPLTAPPPSQRTKIASTRCSISQQDDHTIDSSNFDHKSKLVRKFIIAIENSLQRNNFVSLVLRGQVKKKRRRRITPKTNKESISKKESSSIEDGVLRGSIRVVHGRIINITSSKSKKKSNKRQTKPIYNSDEVRLQLTFKYHSATDIVKNVEIEDVSQILYDLILDPTLASEFSSFDTQNVKAVRAQHIQSAELATTTTMYDLIRLASKSPSLKEKTINSISTNNSSIMTHDRIKNVPLPTESSFLKALGVTNEHGKPKPKMQGKLRQCQKFVEIVGKIVDELQQELDKPIVVVDNGCGRAYLTFSLHHYLKERYEIVRTTGIDVRPKLIDEINGIARDLGGNFNSLYFEEGTIEKQRIVRPINHQKKEPNIDSSLNILIALHACDTATDDALWCGINQKADVIVVAPCCHKQVRPQLNSYLSSKYHKENALSSVLKHGVYRDRMGEIVTDSLRALLLELAGYKVKVFEFVGGEHTSKNVMITAIRSNRRQKEAASIEEEIRSLAALNGIKQQKLAKWMEFELNVSGNDTIPMSMLKMPSPAPQIN